MVRFPAPAPVFLQNLLRSHSIKQIPEFVCTYYAAGSVSGKIPRRYLRDSLGVL
jgi:hypothetical protein